MHSPKTRGALTEDALLDLFAAVENLDRAASVLEVPNYLALRKELIGTYMDLYAQTGRPFDQDAESA